MSQDNRKDYEFYKQKDALLKSFYHNREDLRKQKKLDSIIMEGRREDWEREHIGGFDVLYPLQREFIRFERFVKGASDAWERWTGITPKKKPNDHRAHYRGSSIDSKTPKIDRFVDSSYYGRTFTGATTKPIALPKIHPQSHRKRRSLEIR